MKSKTPYYLLSVYAVVCAVLAFFGDVSVFLGGIMAFPFEQLGLALRALSLSGDVGNVCAVLAYVLFCLLPLIPLAAKLKGKGFSAKDWLLVLLSVMLFAVVYLMINPGLITVWGGAYLATIKAVLGGVCWSVLVSWLVLSLLRDLNSHGREHIQHWMRVLLWALAVWFITAAFGSGVSRLAATVRHVRAANTGRLDELGVSYFVIGLQFAVNALPNVLSAIVAVRGAGLLKAMSLEPYGEETVSMAEDLGEFCVRCLQITVLSCLLLNIAQLPFLNSLAAVSVNVNIPLWSMAFVLAVLMLARFMRENKTLKDDNDMFI